MKCTVKEHVQGGVVIQGGVVERERERESGQGWGLGVGAVRQNANTRND